MKHIHIRITSVNEKEMEITVLYNAKISRK